MNDNYDNGIRTWRKIWVGISNQNRYNVHLKKKKSMKEREKKSRESREWKEKDNYFDCVLICRNLRISIIYSSLL